MADGLVTQAVAGQRDIRASIDHYYPRLIALMLAILLLAASVASYARVESARDVWPWRDQAMTDRFVAAYLVAFAGSLLWVVVTGELAAFAGIAVTVGVNALGMAIYLGYKATLGGSGGLTLHVLAMIGLLGVAVLVFRRFGSLKPKRLIATPKPIMIGMVVYPIVLLSAAVRLILQQRNVFPWDPRPEWSTIIGLGLVGSAAFFAYGAFRTGWTHAGAQFAGFLAYDLVLIFPYVRMLREGDGSSGSSLYGSSGSTVNEGPLTLFLVAIGTSALLAVWYLFIDRETRIVRAAETPAIPLRAMPSAEE
jgi:hypothetical protein